MTPRLVTLAQLLAETTHMNDAQPLFDADSLEIEAGPTPQQVVIHGGKHTSALRKLVDRLNPQHAEIDAAPDPNAPKPAKTTTPAGSDYPLPSAQVLASIIPPDESFPKGHISGLAPGSTLERHTHTPGTTAARASSATRISSDSTATYTATAHSDTPAAATSTTPDSAVTKTHEGQESSGIHPGEGAPRAATAAKKEAAAQEAEKTVSGKPESKTEPKPSELSGAQPHDPSTGQPARAKPDAKPAAKPRSRSRSRSTSSTSQARNATSTAKKKT